MNRQSSLYLSLLAALLLLNGCGKKSDSGSTVAAPPGTVGTTPILPPPFEGLPTNGSPTTLTGSVAFTPDSYQAFNDYVYLHPLNSPSNFRLGVNLHDAGSGRYAGSITISYTDNNTNYTGTFTAPDGVNENYESYGTARDVGVMKAAYNYWFSLNNKTVFSGFFQDNYGGLVLVIDNVVNQGDGQGGGVVSGSVWYRNFAVSFASQSQYRNCWFLYAGPFDCRSSAVISKSSLQPTDTYKKLGTFTGLVKAAAFQ